MQEIHFRRSPRGILPSELDGTDFPSDLVISGEVTANTREGLDTIIELPDGGEMSGGFNWENLPEKARQIQRGWKFTVRFTIDNGTVYGHYQFKPPTSS